jgi:hypothetical protein
VKGFGGIGAILRYKVNFEQLVDIDDEDEFYDGMLDSLVFLRALFTDRSLQIDHYLTSQSARPKLQTPTKRMI